MLVETYLCRGPALFHQSLVLSIRCFSTFLHNSKLRYQEVALRQRQTVSGLSVPRTTLCADW